MSKVTMPEALYTGPDNKKEIIRASARHGGAAFPLYSPGSHRSGTLTCKFCSVAVHYKPGSPMIGGELKGPDPHFATNPRQIHADECGWNIAREAEHESDEFDTSLGYRLHLNMTLYSEEFNVRSGFYQWNRDGHIEAKDPSIQRMERVPIRSAKDVVDFIEKADKTRVKKSIAIHMGQIVEWDKFMIRCSRGRNHQRHIGLVHRLQEGKKPYCLMEMQLQRGALRQERFGKAEAVTSRRFYGWRDEDNKAHFIVPRIYRDKRDDTGVTDSFHKGGSYFVLGYPRLETKQDGKDIVHFLTISVRDPNQFIHADIAEIHAEAVKRHERRIARDVKEHAPA